MPVVMVTFSKWTSPSSSLTQGRMMSWLLTIVVVGGVFISVEQPESKNGVIKQTQQNNSKDLNARFMY
jgi:hypothetical protein